ncbi:MAG: FtsW/RodA/SpoVE family cell cycle protein [Elusimicrobiota bacterium]
MKQQTELLIWGAVMVLGVIGIVMVYSVTSHTPGMENLYIKQLLAFCLGIIVILLVKNISYKIVIELSPVFYGICVLLLIAVLVFGARIHGSKRWLDLGAFHFQPVEFAKLAVIFFSTYLLSKNRSIMSVLVGAGIVGGLVVVQPDAGSALILIPVLIGMFLASNKNTKWLVLGLPFIAVTGGIIFLESYMSIKGETLFDIKYVLILAGLSGLGYILYREFKKVNKTFTVFHYLILVLLLWLSVGGGLGITRILREYHKKRIVSFIQPDIDPLGTGYNTRQALLAVGSGKLTGKGIKEGTQTQLGFLPVRHTDFIFASIAEELGFIGCLIVLTGLGILLWQILNIIERTDDYAARLIGAGIFFLLLTQMVVNIGVTLGLLPVVGMQLPFVSYGGSGLISFMVGIGVLLNINKRTEMIGI